MSFKLTVTEMGNNWNILNQLTVTVTQCNWNKASNWNVTDWNKITVTEM